MNEFLKKIIVEAGDAAFEFQVKAKVEYAKKSATDIVTDGDLLSNKIITDAIKEKYPEHVILSEEGDHNLGEEYTWIIDPIDGTFNYSKGAPLFCVIIGLAYRKEMLMSAVYIPALRDLYFAEKGKGAFLNDKKIHCSNITDITLGFGNALTGMGPKRIDLWNKFLEEGKKHSVWFGSTGSLGIGLSWVCDGKRDWIISRGGNIWDYAASSLILTESGAKISDIKGEPWRLVEGIDNIIAAGTNELHEYLVKMLK
ncbi:MAG: inositol monophosphatase family protein [Candidatus Doudnabacteria bacterium]